MKRQLNKDEASGMTVNERMFLAGLIDDFDKAIAERNIPKLERILGSVYLSPEAVKGIIDQVLK